MPKPRKPENKGLPARWQHAHGAYYYRVPPGLEPLWNGKKRYRLGSTLHEAYKEYAERVGELGKVNTIGQLLDRYGLEVVPAKAPTTQTFNRIAIRRLRAVFGHMPILPFPPRLVYEYVDKRKKTIKGVVSKALTAAHREMEVFSHAYTKAVQWGLIDRHPFKDQVRLDGDLALRPRTRHVEDWEIVECLTLSCQRKKGSVKMIQAYIRLKLLAPMARSDMLRLRLDDHLRDDGIHVTRHKTANSTGKRTIYEYAKVPERKDAVEAAKAVRPALSPFLFCNKFGKGYIDETTGEAHGFDSMWQRFMDRVIAETKVTERFTEHDLRAKAGSDADSLEKARALLQHADTQTTQRFYRRKPERV